MSWPPNLLTVKRLFAFGLALCACAQISFVDTARANALEFTWQELAPGVWAALRQDALELPQEGNAVFVVTDEGVVLFDAGGSPAMGEAIVAKVHAVTRQPITHVVISHWHGDHMRGLQAIQAAFPQIQVFAHPHTRDFIAATREKWLKRRVSMVPNIKKGVESALGKNLDMSGRPLTAEEKAWLQRGLGMADQLNQENLRTDYVIPKLTFTERLVLHLGGREIQFLYLGRAHTAGDLIMWLPQDKIVATGDIVTGPIPLMPSPYAREYVGVLNQIKALDFKQLVPGHGPVEFDRGYVDLLIDLLQTTADQMKGLVARGLSEEDAVAKIDFSKVESRFTKGDAFLAHRFQDYVTGTALPGAAYQAEKGTGPTEQF